MRLRTAVLISGRGSNMQALARAAADPAFPAEIALVLSNHAAAPGLALAEEEGITTEVVEQHGAKRETHEAAIDAALRHHEIALVCLAGYLRILSPFMVRRWQGRMLNIHPSLLPAFPGLDTHARALAAGVKLHGCTVHLVGEQLDDGAILAQAAVPVLADDTSETLATRVLAQEHRIYPLALRLIAGGSAAPAATHAAHLNPLPAAAVGS